MKTKRCKSFCGRVLKLSKFSPNKQYGPKRHPYCRDCCAEKMRRHRELLKQIPRKPSVIWKRKPAGAADKVISAIRNGWNTRPQIRRHAKLRADVLDELLARLILDERKVKSELVNGERLYFEAAA